MIHGYTLETSGALDFGRKVWALARTGKIHTVDDAGRDELAAYVVLATSCDKTLATTAAFTSIHSIPVPASGPRSNSTTWPSAGPSGGLPVLSFLLRTGSHRSPTSQVRRIKSWTPIKLWHLEGRITCEIFLLRPGLLFLGLLDVTLILLPILSHRPKTHQRVPLQRSA